MSDERFRQMMELDSFYLAQEDDEMIGFAQVGHVDAVYCEHVDSFDSEASELRRLYVLSTHQGRGIGGYLIDQVLIDPQVLKAETIYLTTWQENLGAQALYQRKGFRRVGAIPEFQSDGKLDGFEYIMARKTELGGAI